MSVDSFVQNFKNRFETAQKTVNGSSKLYPNVVRANAFESFLKSGIPTTKNEEWKYVNLFPFFSKDFQFSTSQEISKEFATFINDSIESINPEFALVLVNGKILPQLCKNLDSYEGKIIGLDQYYIENPEEFTTSFQSLQLSPNTIFENVATALSFDGFVVQYDKKVVSEKPLFLLNFVDTTNNHIVIPTRYIVKAEKFSQASIIEQTLTFGPNTSLSIATSEVFVDEQANISIVKLQNDKQDSIVLDSMSIAQKSSSTVTSTTVSYGSSLIRNNHRAVHNGSNVYTNMFGLAIAQDKQVIDNHTEIDHATAHCSSTESYKHILSGSSTVVFNGKVFVREQAQKTNAYQSNKTILLSDTATINSKPQLEIFADDVKCSHGATCGGIDEDAIFYLRSRGISTTDAMTMLTFAFAEDILLNIENETVRTRIEEDLRTLLSNRTK